MRRLVARNASLNTVIADHVGVAATRTARAVGLLSRTGLEPGEALWIVPSRGVHTWGMRFTIDVLALDEAGMVIDCVSNLRPGACACRAAAPPACSNCPPARWPRHRPASGTRS